MAHGVVNPSRRKLTFIVLGVVVGVAAVATIVLLARRNSGSESCSATARTVLDGFGETHVSVKAPRDSLAWCMLLAETEAQRNRGLMQVTDPTLGG